MTSRFQCCFYLTRLPVISTAPEVFRQEIKFKFFASFNSRMYPYNYLLPLQKRCEEERKRRSAAAVLPSGDEKTFTTTSLIHILPTENGATPILGKFIQYSPLTILPSGLCHPYYCTSICLKYLYGVRKGSKADTGAPINFYRCTAL